MPAFRRFGAARDAVEKFTMGRRQPWGEGTELEELLLQVDRDGSHGGVATWKRVQIYSQSQRTNGSSGARSCCLLWPKQRDVAGA